MQFNSQWLDWLHNLHWDKEAHRVVREGLKELKSLVEGQRTLFQRVKNLSPGRQLVPKALAALMGQALYKSRCHLSAPIEAQAPSLRRYFLHR